MPCRRHRGRSARGFLSLPHLIGGGGRFRRSVSFSRFRKLRRPSVRTPSRRTAEVAWRACRDRTGQRRPSPMARCSEIDQCLCPAELFSPQLPWASPWPRSGAISSDPIAPRRSAGSRSGRLGRFRRRRIRAGRRCCAGASARTCATDRRDRRAHRQPWAGQCGGLAPPYRVAGGLSARLGRADAPPGRFWLHGRTGRVGRPAGVEKP